MNAQEAPAGRQGLFCLAVSEARPSGRATLVSQARPGRTITKPFQLSKWFIALPINHIIDRSFQVFLRPEIRRTSVSSPRSNSFIYEILFAELSCCVSLETIQHVFWLMWSTDDRMHMICKSVKSMQLVFSLCAYFPNCRFNCPPFAAY